MLFLISLAIALAFTLLLDKPLKKQPIPFYISAAVITIAVIFISQTVTLNSGFVKDYLLAVFSRGALAAAFWCIVMWAGALPNGSALIKKIMPIRGELSIFAAVLTLSHIVTYAVKYITTLINGRTGQGADFTAFILTCIVSIIMVLIMIPLTVMSFKAIRRKMKASTWKKIQRAAYVFYALIYIHILVLFIPKAKRGVDGYFLSLIVYTAVFVGYAVFRLRKYYLAHHKSERRAGLNAVCASVFAVVLAGVGLASFSVKKPGTETAVATGPKRERPAEQAAVQTTVSDVTVPGETTTISADTVQTTPAPDETETTTDTAETTTEDTEEEESTEGSSEESSEEEHEEEQQHEEESTPEPEPQPEPETEAPAPQTVYRDGTYSASAYGYDGNINVTITIENDRITSISASSEEEELDYFYSARDTVINEIISAQDTYVDAVSGATYSSFGIMEAVEKAMESARN